MSEDRFDKVEKRSRVGVHRAPKTSKRRGLFTFLAALAATVVLTVIGLAIVNSWQMNGIDFATPGADDPEVTAVTDPSTIDPALGITISVLNGSTDAALADGVAAALSNGGWQVLATATSDVQVEATTIYYTDVSQEPYARGVAEAMGIGEVQLSDAVISGSPISVIVGEDAIGVAASAEPSDPALEETTTP
ncbi:LytR C-terminal domain-containing protein [Humidisolicoccus flavus]|uniref:LytR C-terminal domain-containing protein n=1 Tax=Humidisolicoccus flavus TaxID=3111414 RepID=UPI0032491913